MVAEFTVRCRHLHSRRIVADFLSDLNRSQPPLFVHVCASLPLNNSELTSLQMLSDYVQASNDTSILARALPLAELELSWWHTNRTLNVTSPFTNNTYEVARYAVNNTAPRPESYLTGAPN